PPTIHRDRSVAIVVPCGAWLDPSVPTAAWPSPGWARLTGIRRVRGSTDRPKSDGLTGRCQDGTTISSAGVAAAQTTEAASTRCRSAADLFRNAACAARPNRMSSETLTTSALLSSFRDEVRNPFQIVVREPRSFTAEHSGNDLFRGPVEEGINQVPQRRLAGGAARYGGRVYVSKAVLFVADVSLFLEDAQLRTNGGVARLPGEVLHHLARSGPAAA